MPRAAPAPARWLAQVGRERGPRHHRAAHDGSHRRLAWESQTDQRAAAGPTLDRDAAAVLLDDLPRYGQAQSCAIRLFDRVAAAVEPLEHVRQILVGDADAWSRTRKTTLPSVSSSRLITTS